MSIIEKIKEVLGEDYETFYLYAEKRHGAGALSAHYYNKNSQGISESGDRQQSRFALRAFLYNLLGHVYASIGEPSFPPEKPKETK